MSKLTAIENAIIQLGDGDFQKFCNTFLSQKQYGKIHGLGMKSGTLKTTIGNPDTYFRKENGKYVFVAYTTQQSSIYGKLKEDIDKCLDPQKTKLLVEEIEEIICCHTSSNLLAGDDNKLHKLCEEKGIKLTIFGVDELAQQVYKYYPLIAKDFLGISVDTNQIMYVDEFVALYDSNDMAAPLDTIFHGRKEELPNVIQAIKDNNVVIVHGPAGTGKTRIVLEAIRQVATDDDYRLFCVKNNNQPIYEDLISKIEQTGRYLLFVDDANELTGLEHVLQYVNKTNPEFLFKVVLTVRDYVKEQVIQIANKYAVSKTILMSPFPCFYLFVEMEKDKFLIKKDGDSQPLLKILSRRVIDTQNNAVIDFFIKWHNVRGEFVNESFYRGQTRLKTWINDKHISSKQVVNEINIQRKLLKEYQEEVERLRELFDVLGLIEQLDIPEEKEEAQLKLMEYNIDADNSKELEAYKQCDKIQAKNDKLKMESKLAALENKLQKHEKYLPDIKELELQEVLRVYQVYLPAIQLVRERVFKVLESHEIFDNTLSPEEFEKLYNETK